MNKNQSDPIEIRLLKNDKNPTFTVYQGDNWTEYSVETGEPVREGITIDFQNMGIDDLVTLIEDPDLVDIIIVDEPKDSNSKQKIEISVDEAPVEIAILEERKSADPKEEISISINESDLESPIQIVLKEKKKKPEENKETDFIVISFDRDEEVVEIISESISDIQESIAEIEDFDFDIVTILSNDSNAVFKESDKLSLLRKRLSRLKKILSKLKLTDDAKYKEFLKIVNDLEKKIEGLFDSASDAMDQIDKSQKIGEITVDEKDLSQQDGKIVISPEDLKTDDSREIKPKSREKYAKAESAEEINRRIEYMREKPSQRFIHSKEVTKPQERRVVIDQRVIRKAMDFAKEFSSFEECGILVGLEDGDKIQILDFIADSQNRGPVSSNVTFTPETWTYCNGVNDKTNEILLDKYNTELKVVGWYHTHPGFNTFLSNADQDIHFNHFRGRGHVAVEYDPNSNMFTIWDNNYLQPSALEKTKRHFNNVFDERAAKVREKKAKELEDQRKRLNGTLKQVDDLDIVVTGEDAIESGLLVAAPVRTLDVYGNMDDNEIIRAINNGKHSK